MLVLSQETISDSSHVVAKWFVEIHSTWESKRISRLINLLYINLEWAAEFTN